MYKLKIFLKTSTKKLSRLNGYKNKPLYYLIKFLTIENNKNYNIILKKILVFLKVLEKKNQEKFSEKNNKNNLYLSLITSSPAKKLKRFKFRAKGRVDNITKENSYLLLGISKRKKTLDNKFISKKYFFI